MRLLERIDEPPKIGKSASPTFTRGSIGGDYDYVKAYEECLEATSTHHAPWYSVPADDKENAHLIVSAIVLHALIELKMAYPKTRAKHRTELQLSGSSW